VICDQRDVVIVPFPFSERAGHKSRPALVFSDRLFNRHGHTVLAMITTTGHHLWPGDVVLANPRAAGLNVPCMVRLKLFMLDNRLLIKRLGQLSASDRQHVTEQLHAFLSW